MVFFISVLAFFLVARVLGMLLLCLFGAWLFLLSSVQTISLDLMWCNWYLLQLFSVCIYTLFKLCWLTLITRSWVEDIWSVEWLGVRGGGRYMFELVWSLKCWDQVVYFCESLSIVFVCTCWLVMLAVLNFNNLFFIRF
jgi:hypothetical protein